ncbi:hypothetical protein [Actinomyces oris]|uniref:hypothetical protein n=1 Tax=Actinomyces oris TaxID=544580 RepID=UPI0028D8B106|nr:hypothetical protein [Actinomyces oris]
MLKDPRTLSLVCATTFLVIGWLTRRLRTKFAINISPHTRKLFEKIEEHLPHKGAIEQAFMLSTTGFLTMWIVTHPAWGLWSFITQSPESPKNTMIGATSIIALLTFVTASMASAAKERTDSPEYLGKSASTYMFSESLVSRLLSTSEFSAFTLIVFMTPFAIDSITTREIWQTDINPHLFVASLWTSCFAVVSVILIVTLLTLLRASTNRLLQPSDVEWSIREAMRRRSASELQGHFSPLLGLFEDTAISAREWVHDSLQELQHLPKEQWDDYIHSTFNRGDLGVALNDRIKSVNRALAINHALPWRVVTTVVRKYCLHSLNIVRSVMQSRNAAIVEVLNNPELPISLRSALTGTLMNEAVFLSTAVSRIRRKEHGLLLESKLLLTEDKLPRPVSMSPQEFAASYSTEPNATEYAKVFELLTATTFQDLAHLIRKRVGLTESDSSTEYVKTIIDEADNISHPATRLYSVNKVIETSLYAAVSSSHKESRLSLRILSGTSRGGINNLSRLTPNAPKNDYDNVPQNTLKDIILSHVWSAFSTYPYMCAEVYGELLRMIPASDVRPTFLHYLTFNVYQGCGLDLNILSHFNEHLTRYSYHSLSTEVPENHYPEHFVHHLHSILTGLTPEGIDWLFRILKDGVDCRFYSSYLELRDVNKIHMEFDTVLLWRIMAGDDFNPVRPVCTQNTIPGIEDYQLTRLREEAGEAAKVLDSLGKNGEADKLRYSFDVPSPKDIGSHDARGPEEAS